MAILKFAEQHTSIPQYSFTPKFLFTPDNYLVYRPSVGDYYIKNKSSDKLYTIERCNQLFGSYQLSSETLILGWTWLETKWSPIVMYCNNKHYLNNYGSLKPASYGDGVNYTLINNYGSVDTYKAALMRKFPNGRFYGEPIKDSSSTTEDSHVKKDYVDSTIIDGGICCLGTIDLKKVDQKNLGLSGIPGTGSIQYWHEAAINLAKNSTYGLVYTSNNLVEDLQKVLNRIKTNNISTHLLSHHFNNISTDLYFNNEYYGHTVMKILSCCGIHNGSLVRKHTKSLRISDTIYYLGNSSNNTFKLKDFVVFVNQVIDKVTKKVVASSIYGETSKPWFILNTTKTEDDINNEIASSHPVIKKHTFDKLIGLSEEYLLI